MNGKILIAYASRCGSTAEVAGAIEQALCKQGASVDVRPVKSVAGLAGYDAVVIGSAVRYGRWLSEATDFVKANQQQLRRLPTAIFTVHAHQPNEGAASRERKQAYSEPVRKLIAPAGEAFFDGKIDLATLSWLEEMVVKAVKSPIGDFRDWNVIRAWAEGLPSLLKISALAR